MPDQPRQVATSPDTDYSLSIDDALALYERAGLPRTPRTVQRYCAKAHLDCRRIDTSYGEKFLITPSSVAKHIAYIEEVRQATTSRDFSRPVATSRDNPAPRDEDQRQPPTGRDERRQAATDADPMSLRVGGLERENELLRSENGFLRGQVTVKDGQIKELTERARETNHLIAGLQKMLTPLLGRPEPSRVNDLPPSYTIEPEPRDSQSTRQAGDAPLA
jgi:hypothetical protein